MKKKTSKTTAAEQHSGDDRVTCRYGDFLLPNDTYIGKSMRLYGEYSEREVAFLTSLLSPGAVVVEAGANVGTITVPLARAVGRQGAVFAYEPQESIYEMLRDNLEGNGLSLVAHPVNLGLGRSPHTAHYTPSEVNSGGVELCNTGEHQADIVTLDSNFDFGRLDLLKVDVEGMEVDVLLGARKTIARYRPLIYAENDRAGSAQRLLDTLFTLGYRVWKHEPVFFNPDNFNKNAEDHFQYLISLNVIAVPEEREPPEQVAKLIEILPGTPQRVNLVKPKWACVARFGGYGDNLMTSSVLPGLRERYGHVEVISQAPCCEVFLNNPYVDKLTVWPMMENMDAGEWAKMVKRRMRETDFGEHLSHTCEASLCFFEHQVEFGWSDQQRRRLANQSYLGFIHDVCDLPHDFAPNFFPTPLEADGAASVIASIRAVRNAPVIGWCLSGSRIDKAYPGSAAAITQLLRLGLNVVMIGAPGKEFLMAKEIERQLVQITGEDERGSSPGLYLALSNDLEKPNWPVRRSFTQLQVCDAVVTPDTGPAWAVAMREMPKVVLLSHASPLNITTGWVNTTTLHADQAKVSCWPCHQLHDTWNTCRKAKDVEAAACMANISVDSIVSAVCAGLNL